MDLQNGPGRNVFRFIVIMGKVVNSNKHFEKYRLMSFNLENFTKVTVRIYFRFMKIQFSNFLQKPHFCKKSSFWVMAQIPVDQLECRIF